MDTEQFDKFTTLLTDYGSLIVACLVNDLDNFFYE